jgi:murein L,D-transpeptidase YcbB/YkuD
MEEGVKGYFDFVSTKRYANLKTATTPLEYCENLKIDGYATSSKYVSTLMSYITTYGLTRFDWDNPEPVCPYKCNVKLVKRGSKGETVGFVQWHLCRHGYTVNIDKNFGPKTELAVCLFQKDHGLTVDGKAGIYTLAALQKT